MKILFPLLASLIIGSVIGFISWKIISSLKNPAPPLRLILSVSIPIALILEIIGLARISGIGGASTISFFGTLFICLILLLVWFFRKLPVQTLSRNLDEWSHTISNSFDPSYNESSRTSDTEKSTESFSSLLKPGAITGNRILSFAGFLIALSFWMWFFSEHITGLVELFLIFFTSTFLTIYTYPLFRFAAVIVLIPFRVLLNMAHSLANHKE